MEYNYTLNQREIYKMLEKLTEKKFANELMFLKALVRIIVNHSEFNIIGGRIWELNSIDNTYLLRFQHGKVKKIPDDYAISISDYPALLDLVEERVQINNETDKLLLDKGINLYSVVGVGNIIKNKTGKHYQFLLGFNALEIMQWFYEILSIISSLASITLRNLSAQVIQKKINKDMLKASEIQRSLLPEHVYRFHDYDIYGVCIPDSAVGGDYFDYLRSEEELEDRLGIVISDAASKGLPAAIQSLFLSGAIRMAMSLSPRIAQLLSRLNNLIWKTFPYERFVTLFYCELVLTSSRLVLYANAGHCPPIYYSAEYDQFKFLKPTGGLLGLVQQQKFSVENIIMNPGDVLVLYTDGITEANNSDEQFYGEDRLCQMIKQYNNETSQNISLAIIEDVQKFSSTSHHNDDKTLVVIKRDRISDK